MIHGLTILLVFQLTGEIIARSFGLPVPGPVIGMALLLAAMALSARVADTVRPTAQGLLSHLSLLFVPAGVGIVGHLSLLSEHGVALFATLLISTVLAIAAGALVFSALLKLTGSEDA